MIQVTVKNLSGATTHQARFETQELADQWVTAQSVLKAFGKPERWVDSEDLAVMGEDRTKAIGTRQVGGSDDERTQYKFAAEYTIEQTDVTALAEQEQMNAASLKYLAETDWYVARYAETGKAIPSDVTASRAAARANYVKV